MAGVDLTNVDMFVRDEHHAVFDALRVESPVHWNEGRDGSGFWALVRYDDVVAAYRDHTAFSSEGGAMLGGSFRSTRDTAAGRMLVASDPPRHRLIRTIVQPALGSETVAAVRRQIEVLLDRALTRMIADGGGDFAADIAPELPAGAVMAMMDVGYEDAHELVRLTRRMIGFRDPRYLAAGEDERLALARFQAEVFEYFADLVRDRRKNPGNDVVSLLAAAEFNGRPMPEADVLYNCMNLAVGGNETTSYTACTGLVALLERPEQYERLLCDDTVRDTAMDEILRWSSTNAYVQRVTTRDVEIRGTRIPCGSSVTLWNVSANRDEAWFPAPHTFDITRTSNRHVSFGSGIHRCVGASVALAELSALIDCLARRRIRMEISGPVERLRSNFILGVNSLPVTVTSVDGDRT